MTASFGSSAQFAHSIINHPLLGPLRACSRVGGGVDAVTQNTRRTQAASVRMLRPVTAAPRERGVLITDVRARRLFQQFRDDGWDVVIPDTIQPQPLILEWSRIVVRPQAACCRGVEKYSHGCREWWSGLVRRPQSGPAAQRALQNVSVEPFCNIEVESS